MRKRKIQGHPLLHSTDRDVHKLLKLNDEIKNEFSRHDNLISQITYPYSAVTTALLQALLVLSIYNPLLKQFHFQRWSNVRAQSEQKVMEESGLTFDLFYEKATGALSNPHATEEMVTEAKLVANHIASRLITYLEISAKCLGKRTEDLLVGIAKPYTPISIHRIIIAAENLCLNTGFTRHLLPYITHLNVNELTRYSNFVISGLAFAMMPAAVTLTKNIYSNYILGLKPLEKQRNLIADMSFEESEDLLNNLTRYNRHLEKIAQRNRKYARVLSGIILVSYAFLVMLTNSLSDNPYSSSLNLTMFLMAYTALTNSFKDITSSVRKVRQNNRINHNKKILEETLQDVAQIDLHGRDGHYAEFVISAKKLTTNTKRLSSKSKAINNMIKQEFLNESIEFKYTYSDVVISASTNISMGKLNKIKVNVLNTIKLSENAKKLKSALDQLSQRLNGTSGTYVFNGLNFANATIMDYYLHIPERFQPVIDVKKLNEIFPNVEIAIIDECNFHLKFKSIDEEVSPELIKNIISDIEHYRLQQPQNGFTESVITEEKRVPPKTKSNNSSDQIKMSMLEDIKTEISLKSPVITWASAMYNPEDTHCKVYPLVIPDKCGLPKDVFYITMALTPEDFKKYPCAFEVFYNLVVKGKFARSNLGEDGLKFTNEIARDSKGMQFVAKGKLKALGFFGDMRCYAEEEKNADGKVLYVVKGMNPHAH